MSLKARRRAFLNKTVKYYNSNNRGVNSQGGCTYSDGCAIGRFLPKDVCVKLDITRWGITDLLDDSEYKILIPKNIRDLGKEFLQSVQTLHDTDTNWNKVGLTNNGQSEVVLIVDKFELKGAK